MCLPILQTYTKEVEDCRKERDGLNDTIAQLKQVGAVCWSLDNILLDCFVAACLLL